MTGGAGLGSDVVQFGITTGDIQQFCCWQVIEGRNARHPGCGPTCLAASGVRFRFRALARGCRARPRREPAGPFVARTHDRLDEHFAMQAVELQPGKPLGGSVVRFSTSLDTSFPRHLGHMYSKHSPSISALRSRESAHHRANTDLRGSNGQSAACLSTPGTKVSSLTRSSRQTWIFAPRARGCYPGISNGGDTVSTETAAARRHAGLRPPATGWNNTTGNSQLALAA